MTEIISLHKQTQTNWSLSIKPSRKFPHIHLEFNAMVKQTPTNLSLIIIKGINQLQWLFWLTFKRLHMTHSLSSQAVVNYYANFAASTKINNYIQEVGRDLDLCSYYWKYHFNLHWLSLLFFIVWMLLVADTLNTDWRLVKTSEDKWSQLIGTLWYYKRTRHHSLTLHLTSTN